MEIKQSTEYIIENNADDSGHDLVNACSKVLHYYFATDICYDPRNRNICFCKCLVLKLIVRDAQALIKLGFLRTTCRGSSI